MKTCTNPKCNATNIPDDAMFCPKCGKPIYKVSASWSKKHNELLKERTQLQEEKQNLCLFEQERQNLLRTLEQDPNFESAMKENIAIIHYNRFSYPSKKKRFRILGSIMVLFFLCYMVGFGFTEKGLEWINSLPLWVTLCSVFGGVILSGIGLNFIVTGGVFVKPLIENQYITNFYIPFIDQYQGEYRYIDDSYCVYYVYDGTTKRTEYDNILEVEIFEPEIISRKITDKIEELDDEIKDIENQMQLMIELNTK
jgi:hypothetical protein